MTSDKQSPHQPSRRKSQKIKKWTYNWR